MGKNKRAPHKAGRKIGCRKAKGVLYATATPIDKAEHIHYLEGTGLFKKQFIFGYYSELGYAYEESIGADAQ